jgi:putative transposase
MLVRSRPAMTARKRPNEHWLVNFVHDQLPGGGRIRVLNIVDDYSCLVCRTAGASLHFKRQNGAVVQRDHQESDWPHTLLLDNSPHVTSKAMFFWSQEAVSNCSSFKPGQASPKRVC